MREGLSRRRGQTTTILEELISTEPRINERIRVPEVRLVGPKGEQVGIVRLEDALRLAVESDLDLVEVAPQARPPVAKLMDYGKFKYEAAQKARDARRNQSNTITKEMKLRLKIDNHDYETKKGHVVRFLKAGDKVKITIMFRGREQSRPELGIDLLKRLADDVAAALPDSAPGLLVGGDLDAVVERIAVSGGAGDSLLQRARQAGADVFLTADLRHHPASEHLEDGRPYLLCGTHWATEWVGLEPLGRRLTEDAHSRGASLAVRVSRIVTDPWALRLPTGADRA